ncbi:MAG TPA: hypothetical protein VL727_04555 [Puia sp.]|nr:hypothetical protein [Puia sp.]
MSDFKTINKKIGDIGLPIVLAFLAIMLIYMFYKIYQIRHHFAFTPGRVTRINLPRWGSSKYTIIFEYKVAGEIYGGNNDYDLCDHQNKADLRALFLGKQFPVVYAVNSPSGGDMLLTQDYADKYKYQLPDSVKFYDSVLSCR